MQEKTDLLETLIMKKQGKIKRLRTKALPSRRW